MVMVGLALSFAVYAQLIGVRAFLATSNLRWTASRSPAVFCAAHLPTRTQLGRRRNSQVGNCWTASGPILRLSGGGQRGRSAAGDGLQAAPSSSSTAAASKSKTSVTSEETNEDEDSGQEQVDTRTPITLISGFLGAGKTSLLQSLLRNRQGVRIGMVVNDMAEVNVDAKLVRDDPNAQGAAADSVELQNGCICCSMSQELFVSLTQLLDMAQAKGVQYDHIVIESSGISEPKSVRSVFQDAEAYGIQLMNEVRLDTMVTVVDAGAFLEAYTTGDRMMQRPDLGICEDDSAFQQSMMEGRGAQRAVVDLLVEQVECADVLVMNKMDTLPESKKGLLIEILTALNPHARVIGCTYGDAALGDVLGVMDGRGVADFGTIDDHKDVVNALEFTGDVETHDCAHEKSVDAVASSDGGGEHSHGHDKHAHEHDGEDLGLDPDCAKCNGGGHDHDHSHSHSRGHGHDHDHGRKEIGEGTTTAAKRFGIDNFVYRQRRPFHPERLGRVLKSMPSSKNLALSEMGVESDAGSAITAETVVASESGAGGGDDDDNPLLRKALGRMVRSKGFMWLAFSDNAAMYWSQAGASFEILCLGRWWDSLERDQWPPEQEVAILEDFEGSYGDRRQELVFIGLGLTDEGTRGSITSALDSCLLTDDEMRVYDEVRESIDELPEAFPCLLRIRFV